MTKPIDRIAFEFWCGIGSVSDFELWVESELRKDEPYPDAYDLFGLDRYQIGKESLKIAGKITGFNPLSVDNKKWVTELVIEKCILLTKEKITPKEFCDLVQTLDSQLLDTTVGIYPDWLSELWNHCDWCDETWTHSNSPHLLEKAKKLINEKI